MDIDIDELRKRGLHVMDSPQRYSEAAATVVTVERFTTADALRSLADWLDEHPGVSLTSPISIGHHTLGTYITVNAR